MRNRILPCLLVSAFLGVGSGSAAEPALAPAPRPLSINTCLKNRHYTDIPLFAPIPGGHRFVETRVQSKSVHFVLDTGACATYFDPLVAKKIGLPEATAPDSGNTVGAHKLWKSDIEARGLLLPGVPMFACDLRGAMENYDQRVPNLGGILGLDVLYKRQAVLDYRSGTAYLLSAEAPPVEPQEHPRDSASQRVLESEGLLNKSILKGKRTGLWYLRAELNGKPVTLLLDSGASENILYPESAKRLGYELKQAKMTVPTAFGTRVKLYQYVDPRIKIDPAKSPATVPFVICDPIIDAVTLDGLSQCDGMLGCPFIEMFGAVFDFGYDRFYFNPHNFGLSEPSLEGTWSVVSYNDGSQRLAGKDIGVSLIIIKGNKCVSFNGEEWKEFSLLTAPWKPECWIDWIYADGTHVVPGIYKVSKDGNKITVSMSINHAGDVLVRPTDFRADKKKGHVVIELEKKP